MVIGDQTETYNWKQIFDGLNDGATLLYQVIEEQLDQRGLYEVLGSSWMEQAELRDRLGIHADVAHRFQLCIAGLRNFGVLELSEGRTRIRTSSKAEPVIDRELVAWTFGPQFDVYLEMYRSGAFLDPNLLLGFEENMDAIWDGLFNAPINLVPRDAAVDWISSPGARVLDLGFGPPDSMRQLAARVGETGRVNGIDSSAHFVSRAERELGAIDCIEQIICADVDDGLAMFEDHSLDGVMFMGALQFVTDPPALFREFARVLRPRAPLALGSFFIDTPCYSGPALQLHLSLFPPPWFVRPEKEIVDSLRECGFELHRMFHVGSFCSVYMKQFPDVQTW